MGRRQSDEWDENGNRATRSSVTKLSSVSDCLENVEGEWLAQNHTPLSGEWAHHSALVESSTRQQAMHMWPKMTGGEAMSAALSMPRGPWQVVMSSREAAGGWWRTRRDKTPHPLAYLSVLLPPAPALSPYFFSFFLFFFPAGGFLFNITFHPPFCPWILIPCLTYYNWKIIWHPLNRIQVKDINFSGKYGLVEIDVKYL